MGKYTVTVSRRADAMLIRHARFLANVSVPASKELVKDFSKVLDALEDNPFQFPVETEYDLPPGQFHKALFYKRYKALFCVEGKNVYLDAVLDCQRHLKMSIFAGMECRF